MCVIPLTQENKAPVLLHLCFLFCNHLNQTFTVELYKLRIDPPSGLDIWLRKQLYNDK